MEDLLKMKGITKVYANGIVANKDVDFSIRAGEIHALMGENGAGKSTLMKILFGLENAEEGDIFLKGSKVKIKSPTDAIKCGIGMVHQHFMLVPSLTVAENMVLGMEPTSRGTIDFNKAIQMTEEVAGKYNLPVDPRAIVADLPVGMKQKVEILKALLRGAQILILDEPTAVLTPQEIKDLFRELLLFKAKGHTIVFISHKLNEIKEICDRMTVMRNGRVIMSFNVSDVSKEDISRSMVGRDVVLKVDKSRFEPGKKILDVKNLSCKDEQGKTVLNNVSLSVRSKEILGIAGVQGNGQRELVDILTGLRQADNGEVILSSLSIKNRTVRDIRALGLSHIPEDRMTIGVAGTGSVEDNLIADKIAGKELNKGILLKISEIRRMTRQLVNDYKVKCSSPSQQVKMLSGGNIQKVVVARELSSSPVVLIADQPARGIDVGATEFIHKSLVKLRDNGTATLLVSADLNEVMELSDSLAVMYGGEIVAYFENSKTVTEEELGFYMLGLKKQTPDELRRVLHEE